LTQYLPPFQLSGRPCVFPASTTKLIDPVSFPFASTVQQVKAHSSPCLAPQTKSASAPRGQVPKSRTAMITPGRITRPAFTIPPLPNRHFKFVPAYACFVACVKGQTQACESAVSSVGSVGRWTPSDRKEDVGRPVWADLGLLKLE